MDGGPPGVSSRRERSGWPFPFTAGTTADPTVRPGGANGPGRSPANGRKDGGYFLPECQIIVTRSIETEAGQGAIRKNWSGCSITCFGVVARSNQAHDRNL